MTRSVRWAMIAVALVVLSACGARSVPAQVGKAGACPGVGGLAPGSHELSFKVGGDTRESLVYVPESAQKAAKVPLVIVLHGGGGTGKIMQKYTRMDPVADANGFIVAYPTGTKGMLGGTWNGGDCCGNAMRKGTDDVTFLRTLIDTMVAERCVDPARVYMTGVSNGGIMSYRMACEAADKVAAIAPVAAAPMTSTPCKPSRPVSTIIFHGTDDKSVTPEGNFHKPSDPKRAFPPLAETVNGLVAAGSCSKTPKTVLQAGDGTCVAYGGCSGSAEVQYCKVEGGGHTWPGGVPALERRLGHTSRDLNASEVMWKFFERHPMPGAASR